MDSPKSLSHLGRGTLNPAPLLPFWEKGLGDEGQLSQQKEGELMNYPSFYFRCSINPEWIGNKANPLQKFKRLP